MYGSWDITSIKDGELLDFYDGLTDLERIQYDVFGSPHDAWLRSPYPSNANNVRNVNASTGAINNNNANNANGAAPRLWEMPVSSSLKRDQSRAAHTRSDRPDPKGQTLRVTTVSLGIVRL